MYSDLSTYKIVFTVLFVLFVLAIAGLPGRSERWHSALGQFAEHNANGSLRSAVALIGILFGGMIAAGWVGYHAPGAPLLVASWMPRVAVVTRLVCIVPLEEGICEAAGDANVRFRFMAWRPASDLAANACRHEKRPCDRKRYEALKQYYMNELHEHWHDDRKDFANRVVAPALASAAHQAQCRDGGQQWTCRVTAVSAAALYVVTFDVILGLLALGLVLGFVGMLISWFVAWVF